MKVIYKVDKDVLLICEIDNPSIMRGMNIEIHYTDYNVVSTKLSHNIVFSELETALTVHLRPSEVKPGTLIPSVGRVQCVFIKGHTSGNLTIGKIYDIFRESKRGFSIICDTGKERQYTHDSTMFRRIQ